MVAVQVNDLLRDSGQDLGVIIANLLTTMQVTTTRTDGIEELLVAFPMVTATAPGANPDGTGHLGLVLTFNDPFSCTKGYEGTNQRGANETTDVPLNEQAYCAEPPGSPIGVRGSQNAPFGGKPVEVPMPPPRRSGGAWPAGHSFVAGRRPDHAGRPAVTAGLKSFPHDHHFLLCQAFLLKNCALMTRCLSCLCWSGAWQRFWCGFGTVLCERFLAGCRK